MNRHRRKTALLVHGGNIVADPCESNFIEEQAIAIDGDTIAAVGSADEIMRRYPDAERLNAKGCLIVPGLIDAHTHTYGALSLGMPLRDAPPTDFVQVIERVWWRLDKSLTLEDVYVSALVGSLTSMKNGITTVFDHHASPSCACGSLDQVAKATQECGLRACLAYEVSDRDGSEAFSQGISENVRFIERTKQKLDVSLRAMFGLHALFTLSAESIDYCRGIAEDLDAPFHLHVAEHKTEVERSLAEHNQTVVEFLVRHGILGEGSIAAHGVHVDTQDIERLRDSGSLVVHNPQSNMGNGVGISPALSFQSAAVPVGIGSDGLFDVASQMQTALLLQNLAKHNPSAFGAADVVSMMYRHNARLAQGVFGRQFGRIQAGYVGDLILAPYDPPTPMTSRNLSSHLLGFLSSLHAPTVVVGGKVILERGNALHINELAVMETSRARAKELWERMKKGNETE